MMNINKAVVGIAALASALLASSPVLASTATGTLTVQASVVASCAVNSVTNINFGSVTAPSTTINAAGSISLTCTASTPWYVTTNSGSNASGSQMRMVGGSYYLNYNLYSDSNRTVYFPTTVGTLGSGNTGGAGAGAAQTVLVYGQIPTQTLPIPGNFSDTVTLTVNY